LFKFNSQNFHQLSLKLAKKPKQKSPIIGPKSSNDLNFFATKTKPLNKILK